MRNAILFALLAAFVAGCSGGLIRPKVESAVRKSLHEYIGPADEYTVRAEGSTSAMVRGRIEALHIVGRNARIAEHLVVSRLVVDMTDVEVDPTSRKLQNIGSTTFGARITEQAVNDYTNATRTGGSEIRVELEAGKLVAIGRPSFHGIGTTIRVSGQPKIVGGTRVSFVADSASVSIVPVPSWIVNRLLDRVNPVLNLEDMSFPVSLTRVTVREGAVDLAGKANFQP